jgi:hypothetical protein
VSGSQATLRSAPFTVSRNSVSIMVSSWRQACHVAWGALRRSPYGDSAIPNPDGAGLPVVPALAGSEGFQRFGSGHDPAQGAVFVQVAEHLDADGLV